MGDTQTYNHNDIQRYLQHKMTPQEMHDFEKSLMNDPFLADALDGFLSTDANLTQKHLSEIESELTGQKEKAKAVTMPLQKKAWWKVAAIVFFIAAGGVFFYSLMSKSPREESAAYWETAPKAAEKVTITDSMGPVEKPLAQVDILPKKIPVKKRPTPIITESKELPMAMQSMQMRGDSLQANTIAKKEEDFALLSRSSAVSKLAAPRASNDTDQKMATLKMATPLSQKEQEFKGKISDEKAVVTSVMPRLKDNEAGAEPEGGWKNFENYILSETNNFKGNISNYNKQEIELEFSINSGKPDKIKVSEQADKSLAQKAIEILKNGPAWTSKKKDKTVRLIIPF